ncbi:topoisomerase VIA [Cryptosporidium sp. chipmunk genotype I]|uniref:topoisomerase VIA n=1 Tax=Cryptosporidium sp. chipmunk genotype I TaxID=1280935 RepID=UPI00351A8A33|nr:topoisomerase VIA [Cryptosporidium sp. chipmunk genotype I]
MNLIEDIVLFNLGKSASFNALNWIGSFQVDQFIISSSRRKSDVINIAKITSIANVLHNAQKKGRRLTLRELYYHNSWLFKSQSQVNRIVQNFSEILQTPRISFGLFPSPKGMIGGRIKLIYKNSDLLDVEELGVSGATITDIFDLNESKYIIKTNVRYILLIEKASIFQYLMEREVYNRIPCLIITGKGFPDISTRKLVSDIIYKSGITALYLGDFDPHGINIYLTYVRGSNSFESQMTACSSIYYLGIHYEDTKLLPSDTKIVLSEKDRSILKSLIEDPTIKECEMLCQQCKLMNEYGFKCELEAFQSISSDYLVNIYLPGKILKRAWI